MKAIVLQRFGRPEALEVSDWPDPEPSPGWAVVELRAAALNWHDVIVRRGDHPVGSGVSTIAVALARMAGARVLVTSSSRAKIDRAVQLGASGGVLYTDPDWPQQLEPADLVVDSVGSTWPDSLSILKPGGRVVAFGATGGDQATVNVRPFYFGQFSLLGTTMGSPRDFARLLGMLDPAWRPAVEVVLPLDRAAEAHARMELRDHFGKLVLVP